MNVAILGASRKPNRFSYKAFKMLQEHGHKPIPVTPKMEELEGFPVCASIKDIKEPVDTLSMYVNAERSSELAQEILDLAPRRVIFNPGSENPELEKKLKAKGIEVQEDCTLVMLGAGRF